MTTVPTDEDFLVAIEEALETNLLPTPGFAVLEATRDAVLAGLGPLVEQLRHTPAATCTAQYQPHLETTARQCFRAARHTEKHTDASGFHWTDNLATYPTHKEHP